MRGGGGRQGRTGQGRAGPGRAPGRSAAGGRTGATRPAQRSTTRSPQERRAGLPARGDDVTPPSPIASPGRSARARAPSRLFSWRAAGGAALRGGNGAGVAARSLWGCGLGAALGCRREPAGLLVPAPDTARATPLIPNRRVFTPRPAPPS